MAELEVPKSIAQTEVIQREVLVGGKSRRKPGEGLPKTARLLY